MKRAGFGGNDSAKSIISDKEGNVIVTGQYRTDTIFFDSTSVWSDRSGFFLTKFDPTGNVLWLKSARGQGTGSGESVTVDEEGNIIVVGAFQNHLITFDSITFTNSGSWDCFLVKYDPLGNVLWARKAGGDEHDNPGSVATDMFGNILITGRFQSPALEIESVVLTNTNTGIYGFEAFIAKYSPDGSLLWARSIGGISEDGGTGIDTDGTGNVYLTGRFRDTLHIDSFTLSSAGYIDIFIIKFDPSGNIQWAKSAGGDSGDYGESLVVDENGDVLISGYFGSDEIAFDTIIIENSNFVFDIFLAKYDASGNVVWATSVEGNSLDAGYCMTTDHENNILIGGAFSSNQLDFGGNILFNTGGQDFFIAQYDPLGNNLWALNADGFNYDEIFGIATDKNNDILIAGGFWSDTLIAGPFILANHDTSGTSQDIFIGKLSVLSTQEEEIPDYDSRKSLKLYPNPSDGLVMVDSELRIDALRVYDLLGRLILNESVIENQFSFVVKDPGFYVVTAVRGDHVEAHQLVIRKDH